MRAAFVKCKVSGASGKLVIFILLNGAKGCSAIGDNGGVQTGIFDAMRQTFEGQNGNNPTPRHADSIFDFVSAIFLAL